MVSVYEAVVTGTTPPLDNTVPSEEEAVGRVRPDSADDETFVTVSETLLSNVTVTLLALSAVVDRS